MNERELRPCPFCGGKAEIGLQLEEDVANWKVEARSKASEVDDLNAENVRLRAQVLELELASMRPRRNAADNLRITGVTLDALDKGWHRS